MLSHRRPFLCLRSLVTTTAPNITSGTRDIFMVVIIELAKVTLQGHNDLAETAGPPARYTPPLPWVCWSNPERRI